MTTWKKSSRCGNATCVEVGADEQGRVLVRDSKNPEQAPLVFTPQEWAAFLAGARAGEFGHLEEADRNARAYGWEIGRGKPISGLVESSPDNPFLDPAWAAGLDHVCSRDGCSQADYLRHTGSMP